MLHLVSSRRRRVEAPGPRYRTPFAFLGEFRRDPIQFAVDAFRTYGELVRIRFAPGEWGPFASFLVSRPEHVKHVLHDNAKNYWKGIALGRLRIVMGDGLIVSEGEFWRRQRRMAQPAFHRQRIETFVSVMTDSIRAMLERWRPIAIGGEPFDMGAEMGPLTMSIVGRAMVGRDFFAESAELLKAGLTANEFMNTRLTQYFPPPLWLPTRKNREFRRALALTEAVVYQTIAERRRASDPGDDLLGMMLAATDPDTGESMSDRQLRDELFTILGAGQETTAILLSWTWWLLGTHPEVEARLRHEIATVLGDRVPTVQDVPALAYARMVLQEALRLYPPVWALPRQAVAEDEIGGYRVPAGAPVTLCPYLSHRHPDFWRAPEIFDPENFAPAAVEGRPRFAYYPFGGGPRVCIGLEFALLEAQLTIAMVCQRYRFRLLPDRPVERGIQLTLRPRNGVWMTLIDADRPRWTQCAAAKSAFSSP